MKKKLLVGLCTAALAISLVGCGGSDEKKAETPDKGSEVTMKDGTYEVETKNADDNGGKAKVVLTVADGKITKAAYNEFTDKGNKREDKEYNDMMKEKAGTNPAVYEVELEKKIVESQSGDFDAVTGATSSSDKAKVLVKEAINNANEGKAEKELIEIK